MKKVLLLSEIFPPVKGGSGRWFWEIYTRMKGDTVVAAGESDKAQSFDQKSPLKTYRLPLSSHSWGLRSVTGLKFYWRIYRKICKIVKEGGIEVLHCGRCIPEGFIAYLIKKRLGTPYICFIHGEDVEMAATSRELSWIVRKALNNAEYLVCNSQNTANILLQQWAQPDSRVKVINPGVDAEQFTPADSNLEIRSQLGWQQRPVILTVGRLQKRKGHDKMIEALLQVKKVVPDVLYAIIGDGAERTALQAQVKALELTENVLFMSEISDAEMIHCYQQCDLFILPNRTEGRDIEGFGMVLVEAQACGKPVIAGDSGGTAETMLVNESGYIIDCTDPTLIAERVTTLLQDSVLATEMGKKGVEHVRAKLDWQALSNQAEIFFENV